VSADQRVHVVSPDADLVVVLSAELDVGEGIEVAVWLAVVVEQMSGPVTLKWTFIGSSCS
jgi:hypothetical protein